MDVQYDETSIDSSSSDLAPSSIGSYNLEYETCGKIAQVVLIRLEHLVDGLDTLSKSADQEEEYGSHSRPSSVQTQPDNWDDQGQDNSQLKTASQDQGQTSDGVDDYDMSTHEMDRNQDINEDENYGQDILDDHGQRSDHNLQHPIEMIVLKPEKGVGEEEEEEEEEEGQQQQQHGLIVEGIQVKKDEIEEDTLIHNESFRSHSSYIKPDYSKVENVDAIEEGESNEKYNSPFTMIQMQVSSPNNIVTTIENTKSESKCSVLDAQNMSAGTVGEQCSQTSFEHVKETLDKLLPERDPYHDINKPALLIENAQQNLIGTEKYRELIPCNLYGESFNNTKELSIHSETHTGEHPYNRFEFNDKSHLTTHLETHSGERPYSCETCGNTFKHKKTLTRHLLTHTGERPFSCEFCEKTFARKSNLVIHLRSHTGERPFSCELCGKKFNQKSNLATHLQTHSGKKPYKCEFCDHKTSNKYNCNQHQKSQHTGEQQSHQQQQQQQQHGRIVEGIQVKKDEVEEDKLIHNESFPSHSSYIKPDYSKVENVEAIEEGESNEKYNSPFTMIQMQVSSPNNIVTTIENTKSESECSVLDAQNMSAGTVGEQCSQTSFECVKETLDKLLPGLDPYHDINKPALLIENTQQNLIGTEKYRELMPCNLYGESFNNTKELSIHSETHTGEHPYNRCEFNDKSHLATHLETHTGERPYSCETCSKTFKHKKTLTTHLLTHTGERPFSCEICEKKFRQKAHLATHLETHTGERPYSCETCSKTFKHKKTLTRHLLAHTTERPFRCEFCDKKFKTKYDLLIHLRLHTGERPFSCKLCKKKYIKKSQLKFHLQTHSGEKPYKCEFCDYKTSNKYNCNQHKKSQHTEKAYLTRHLLTLSGERPFGCELCDKKFKTKYDLVIHLHLHTGERPFSCKLCEKKYIKKSQLKIHLQTHSGEKPYKCEFCDYKTSSKSDLNKHQRRKHKGETYYRCHCRSSSVQTQPDNWDGQGPDNPQLMTESQDQGQASGSVDDSEMSNHEMDQIQDITEDEKYGQDILDCHGQRSDHNLQHPIEMIVLKPEKEVGEEEEEQQQQQQSQQLQQQQHGRIVEGIQVEKDEMEEDTFIHNQSFPSHSSYIKLDHSKVDNVVAIIGKGKSNEKHNSSSIIMQDILDCHGQCPDHNNLQHPIEMIVLKPEKWVGEEEEEGQQQQHEPHQQQQQQQHGLIVEGIKVKKDEMEEDTLIHNQSFHSHSSYMKPDHLKVENLEAIEEGESNEKYNPPSTMMQLQDSSPDNIITAIENTKSESECPVLNTQYMSARTVREQHNQTSFECVKETLDNLLPRPVPYHDRNKPDLLLENAQPNLIGTENCGELKPCNLYGELFNNTRELSFHSETHTGEHPYTRYEFNDKSHLTTDLQTHTVERSYSCETCGKTFQQKGSLTTHLLTHTGEKPFRCEVCDKTFNQKANLTRHLLTHTEERPFSCEFCDKTFKEKSTLITHLHLHTGERPYGCEFCEKTFIAKSHLVAHLPTHTGERPFRCEFCDKKFRTKYILGIHLRLHTGERPFSCKLCEKKYIKESHLKFHLRTHSGEKPYKCEFCDYKTSNKYNCNQHQKRQHTGEQQSQQQQQQQQHGRIVEGIQVKKDEIEEDTLIHNQSFPSHSSNIKPDYSKAKNLEAIQEGESNEKYNSPSTMMQIQDSSPDNIVTAIENTKSESECPVLDTQYLSARTVQDTSDHNNLQHPIEMIVLKPAKEVEKEEEEQHQQQSQQLQQQQQQHGRIVEGIQVEKDVMEKHTGEKPFSCEFCDKKFRIKPQLVQHLRLHTGERPYSCEICNKTFNQKSTLVTHLYVHTGERPYSCEICNKTFIKKSHLVTHLRAHTGERPFSCEYCDKKFRIQSNLVRHSRLHTGERPFSCELCERKFMRKAHLATHLQTHSGEKPYKCEFCDYKTSNKYNCNQHQKSQHTGEQQSQQQQQKQQHGRIVEGIQVEKDEMEDDTFYHNQSFHSHSSYMEPDHSKVENVEAIEEGESNEKYNSPSTMMQIQDSSPDNIVTAIENTKSESECPVLNTQYMSARTVQDTSDHNNLQHPIEMIVLKPAKEVGKEEEQHQQQSQQLQQQQHGRIVEGIQVEKDEMEEDTFIHNQIFPSHSSYIKPDHSKVENVVAIVGEGESNEKHNSPSIIMQDILDCHVQCSDHNNLQHPIEMIVLKPEKEVGEEEEEEQQQSHQQQHQQQQHGRIVEGIQVKKDEIEEDTLIHNQSFHSHSSYMKPDHLKVENVEAIEEGESNEKYNPPSTIMQIQDSSPDNIITAIENTKSESECPVLDTQYMIARTVREQCSQTSFECVKRNLNNLFPRLDPYHDRNKAASLIETITQQNLIGTEKYREIMPCNFYGESFNNTRELSFHSETHAGEHPYNRYEFNDKSHLTTDLQTHTGESPFSCETCGETFKHKQLLTRHLLTHTGERPYSCEFCDKTFKKKTTLTTHLHLHTGERPYACEFCEKTFITKSHLVAHLPTHTGERPFRCEFCDKKFRTKYILGIHLRLHTGERPFSCKLCKKKYIKESQLKFHLQTHSGEKPYKCEFCDYKTSYKYDCIKHQKRQHTGCHSRSSSVQTQPDNWEGRGQDNSQLMTESQDQGQASDGVDKSDMSTHELDQNQDINEDENCGQDILNYHGQCSDHNLQHPIEMIVLKPEKEVGEEEEDQQQQSQQLQQQQHGRLVEGIQVKKDEIVEDTLIHNESFPSHSSYIKPDYSKVENVDAIKEGESNDKYNPPSTMMQIQDSSPDNIITAIENTKSESECSVLDAQNMSAGTVGEQTLTGERPYSCETCGKTFKHKKLLTRHFLKHTGQRPFSCEFCDKKFRTKATLTTHLHLHTGERPYGCKYCEKTYITKSHLVAHLPTHTGERRFSCEFCEKTFMSSSYLVKHLRSHTGERPFSCEMCGKKFIQKQHLATHLQTHSGEKPYKCEFCDYKTSNKYDCKNHQRRQHTGCHSRSSSFQTQPYNWNGRGLNNSQLMTESQDQAQASGSVDDSKMSNHEMNQNQDVIEDEKYGQVSLDYHGQRSDHNLQHPIEMILLKPEKEVGEEEEEEQQQQSQQLQQQQHGRTVEGIQVEKDEMEEDTFIHNQSFPSHSSYIKLDHSKVENIVAIIGEGESDEKHNSSSIIMQDILDCHGQCPDHNNLQHPIEMIVLKPEKGVGEEEEEGQQQQHEPHQQQQHGLIVEGIKVKKYEMEENTLIHNQTFTSHKSYIKQDHSKVENVEAIEEGELNEKHNSSTTMMQIQDSSPDNIVTAIDNTKSESECHVLDTQYMSARTFIDRRSHTSFECVKETLDNLLPRLDPYDRNKPASLIENAQQNLIGTEKYREIMPCNFYGESFNNTRELSFHSETHTGEHPYNRYEFNDKSHLTTHLQTCTGERPYSCETCGKTFKHKQLLTRHLLTHTGERPYSCELCDKTFARKSNLNKHLHLHTGQRPFSCEFCDKTFKEKTTLTTHLHLHTGERPYGCKFCEKTFIAKSHLVAHLPTHTGERLFSCEFCEKTFMSNSNLVIHLRSHTGERPFSCELCEKKFIQKHHLATHLLTHSGEKPYKCEFCDYQTSNKYDCKNHQRRQHTGETYYRCQLCGYICSNPSSFATHQSSHAGVQPHSSGVSVGYDESSNPSISQVSDNPQFILPTL